MNPDLWNKDSLVLLVGILPLIFLLFRHWPKIRKIAIPIAVEARRDPVRLVSALMLISTVAFALIFLTITAPQADPLLRLLANFVGGFVVFLALALIFGERAYKVILDLKGELQTLEETMGAENQRLKDRLTALEAQKQNIQSAKQLPPRKEDKKAGKQTVRKKKARGNAEE